MSTAASPFRVVLSLDGRMPSYAYVCTLALARWVRDRMQATTAGHVHIERQVLPGTWSAL